jgi:predicted ester cyclase
MTNAHEVVAAFWAAAEARDWDTVAGLVAEQVIYEAPQFRERVRGRIAYRRFNVEGFPGDWHLSVERIVGDDRHAASWLEFSDAGDRYPGVCFFDLNEGGRSPGSPTSGPLRRNSRTAVLIWSNATEFPNRALKSASRSRRHEPVTGGTA